MPIYAGDHLTVVCVVILWAVTLSLWKDAPVTSIPRYILIRTPQQLAKCTNIDIKIGGNDVHALKCVRNLGT